MSSYRELFEKSIQMGIDPVDSVIASTRSIYQLPIESHNEMKLELIKYNFQYHYTHNALYRKICEEKEVTLPDIQRIEEVALIPAIGIGKFKDVNAQLLLTKPIHDVEYELRSTGTSGIPSISRRDEQTLTHGS